MATSQATAKSNNINLETYCLIWLDGFVNHSRENFQIQRNLQKIINCFLPLETEDQCREYIRNLPKNDRIILIVSGKCGREIVPEISHLQQIVSIYIFCLDKKFNEQWSRKYSKVKSVTSHGNELIQLIQDEYTRLQYIDINDSLTMNFLIETNSSNSNGKFLYSQILIDCLIRMESTNKIKNEFISFCKKYYENNSTQLKLIEEFSKEYSSENSLFCYTKYPFLSRLLNKALREENIDLLFLCRFAIHDIGCQLGGTRSPSLIHVYRCQLMSTDEIQCLIKSEKGLISFDTFLLTNVDRRKTLSLFANVDDSNNIEKVFFEITLDSELYNIRPYNILPFSNDENSNDKQILFMVGSIFRIDQIKQSQSNIWNVQLTLCPTHDPSLKSYIEKMKKQLSSEQTNLFQFSKILVELKKFNYAEKYMLRYLNQLPNDHPDVPKCYSSFGKIAESKHDFPSSLKWYKKSLKLLLKTSPLNEKKIGEMYSKIANIYSKQNDNDNSMKFYKKLLEIQKKIYKEDDIHIVKCLNEIGLLYFMKKDYSKASEHHEQALEILIKKNPNHNCDTAKTMTYLADVCELTKQSDYALSLYSKALEIYHMFLPETKRNIDDILKKIND